MFKHFAVLAAAATMFAAIQAGAQKNDAADYPNRTVRIIVATPPASGPDTVARLLADNLHRRWSQPVVVENRAGAGGTLAAEVVAGSEPDGYALLAAAPMPLTTSVLLYKKLSYDPATLEPVMLMATLPNTLVVRSSLPVNNVAELIAYAKAGPGTLNYGSTGIGTTPHLTAELFASVTGTKLTHIPYRGTALAVNDLVAGHLDTMFVQLDVVRDNYRAGKLKMLAVTTERRIAVMPEVPTMAEAGVPDFRSDTWNAIAAPAKTPKAVIAKINSAMNDVFRMPEIRDHLAKVNMTPLGGTPAEMAEFLKAETRRWGEVIRAAEISAK